MPKGRVWGQRNSIKTNGTQTQKSSKNNISWINGVSTKERNNLKCWNDAISDIVKNQIGEKINVEK